MTKTYSPKRLILAINGVQITGFSDTDIVTVTQDEPKFVKYIAVDGDVSRSYNPSSSGRFVISLNQTSQANEVLSTLLALDVATNTGEATFVVTLRDTNSNGTSYIAKNCWVENMPESSFSKEITTREWVIDTADMSYFVAGHSESLFEGVTFGF